MTGFAWICNGWWKNGFKIFCISDRSSSILLLYHYSCWQFGLVSKHPQLDQEQCWPWGSFSGDRQEDDRDFCCGGFGLVFQPEESAACPTELMKAQLIFGSKRCQYLCFLVPWIILTFGGGGGGWGWRGKWCIKYFFRLEELLEFSAFVQLEQKASP